LSDKIAVNSFVASIFGKNVVKLLLLASLIAINFCPNSNGDFCFENTRFC
jgi:hypothetical protein